MGGRQSDSRQALVKLKIPSQELCFMKCYLRTKKKRCVLLIWGRSIRVKNHCQVGGTTKFKGATKGWRNNYWVKGHNQGGRIKGNMGVRGTKPQELSVERQSLATHTPIRLLQALLSNSGELFSDSQIAGNYVSSYSCSPEHTPSATISIHRIYPRLQHKNSVSQERSKGVVQWSDQWILIRVCLLIALHYIHYIWIIYFSNLYYNFMRWALLENHFYMWWNWGTMRWNTLRAV